MENGDVSVDLGIGIHDNQSYNKNLNKYFAYEHFHKTILHASNIIYEMRRKL